ncbi:uncharacterized protein LOC129570404 [Sitodiplosis mosellana]|uniref:uncharacterized protein LOC129570404 n=1 Tax=Sitodiplosis mosellana TaxID=263140 RepID=UPI002444E150|nr:uncharacterized protein LOC129570404 [Sitodiplosis mosellana]XP_055305969.1 uncharacterized protein LOC129570404 [Sitodiplosis mosellana]XP_055305970.1 uncharacterized protein LOC129570404 [Sitodiplosis mosellana]XP_055305971.1 uncharacterized protein LOC129570404 [Sitodiplosis mosellana]XP_055305972.1 uncharacterized protein LOC129570404 [Sitodiplosis mosellana]XP_055305973.1 uncharacterized protein LOC129570404 [Sitodiplosis mosellana]XP_055305974.1 uncharacterized protein LOC129570404 [
MLKNHQKSTSERFHTKKTSLFPEKMTDTIVYKNVLAWRGCERLYMDTRTCDVFFLFKSDNDDYEKVPAHKSILSSVSPVFDAMFYGSHKQSGDIKIVDSTPHAFKEFLQFFYLGAVKLTAENVPEIMYLSKEYMLNDCLNACADFCKATLTLDTICWGYELAILFEQDGLKRYCERKISENTKEIFQSNSFLSCESNLLRHILQLNSLKCDESVVFDGCIAWAKAVCVQKGVDEMSMQNLRAQLGELFDEIRFGRMKLEHFYPRYLSYAGLFSAGEFQEIISKIAFKDFCPRSFNRNAFVSENHFENEDVLVCDRKCSKDSCQSDDQYRFQTNDIFDNLCVDKTIFRTNCLLMLKRFVCRVEFSRDNKTGIYSTEAKIRINEAPSDDYPGILLSFVEVSLNNSDEIIVELPSPVVISAGVKYEIEFEMETGITYSSEKATKQVRMEQGIIADFFGVCHKGREGIVKCLHFAKQNE